MKQKIRPIDIENIKTCSLDKRKSKVSTKDFGKATVPGGRFSDFLEALPNILAGSDLRAVVGKVAEAVRNGKPVLMGMGAHVIKVGLSPILIALMKRGVISGLAVNGACIIHDAELAMVGRTSEDVEVALGAGDFGMAEETCSFLNEAISGGAREGLGMGEAIGKSILSNNLPYSNLSLLGMAAKLDIPVTVHVAVGTDIIHMHPQADGAAIGKTSLHDFRLFCSLVAMLEGGVYLNVGSAVILPEVFLKALSVARNLGHEVKRFTTVNMDFIRHYRPMTNVVSRPTKESGQGYCLVGHHEIMVPLLAAAILEELHA